MNINILKQNLITLKKDFKKIQELTGKDPVENGYLVTGIKNLENIIGNIVFKDAIKESSLNK